MQRRTDGGSRWTGGHPLADLAAHAAGTLGGAGADAVAAHLATCPSCRAETELWRRVGQALRAGGGLETDPAPGGAGRAWAELLRRRARGLRPGRPPLVRAAGLWRQLVAAQLRVIPGGIWLLGAASTAAAVLLALLVPPPTSGALLGLIVSAVGGVSVALACGADADPCAELALSLPTRPRAVFLARLGLLLVFEVALGLGASAALVALHGPAGLWGISGLWLGPLVALGALAAVLSVVWGSVTAASGVLAVWALRLFGGPAVAAHWHTSLPVLLCAAVLLAAAACHRPRLARPA